MKKSFFSIAIIINLLIFSSTISFGQSDFFYDNLMPEPVHPAPSSFNSALKVEPSMIYGKIQVSYPIYAFKLKDYTLPISLNYSSAGVRVMDVSGWVGLGWNINAGGVIVRNTRGYPDDYKSEYISHRFNEDWSHSEHHNKAVVGAFYCGNKYTEDALRTEGQSSDIQDEIDDAMFFHNASTVLDAEPDEFAFACGPYSGSFFFDTDGTIHIKSDAKLKIEYTFEVRGNDWFEITSFTITTPDGVKYKFGTTEDSRELKYDYIMQSNCILRPQELNYFEAGQIRTANGLFYTFENNCENQPTALPNNARFIQVAYFKPIFEKDYWQRFQKFNIHDYIYKWYLKEIITPQKNTITFNYQSGGEVQYVTDFNESISVGSLGLVNVNGLNPLFTRMTECGVYVEDWTSREPYTSPFSFGELLVCPHDFNPTVVLTFSNQSIKYTPKYLSSIVASNGYSLVFNTSNDRPDMPGAKRLNEIDLQYNSSTFKKIGLGYETYHSNEPNIMPELEIGNGSFKRDYQFRSNGDVVNDFQETEAMLEASKHRLFLSSITEYDESNNSLPPYVFKYNNDVKLPRRISNFRSSSGYFINNNIYTRIGLDKNSSESWKAGGLNIENHIVDGFYPFNSKYKIITGQELNTGLTGTDVKSGLLKEIDLSSGSIKKINYLANVYYGCSVTSIDSYDDDNLIKSENYSFTEQQGRSKVFNEDLDLGYFYMDEFIIGVNKNFACYGCNGETVNVRANKTRRRYNIHQYNYYSYNIINRRYDSETSAIYKKDSVSTNENGSVVTSIKPYSENEPIWYDHDFNPQVKQISSSSMTTDNDAESAMLLSKEIKDADGNVLINETYNIDSLSGGRICNGMYPYRLLKHENSASVTPRFYGAIYWNSNKWANYTNITRTESFGSGKEISKTQTFGYNTNLKLKTEETITYDASNSDKNLTKYSGEYLNLSSLPTLYTGSTEATALIRALKKYMINTPVEKLAYKNGKIIGGSLVTFQSTGDIVNGFKIYPYKEYRLVVDSPIEESNFSFSHLHVTTILGVSNYSFEKDSRYELVRTYDKFDDYGNILQYHDEYGINTSFFWNGDYKQFMTAQVNNANWFDIYYNGFEYGTLDNHVFDAHSGNYSYKIMPGESFNDDITDVVQNKKYKLSAWIKTQSGFDNYADVLVKVWDKQTGTVLKAWLTKFVYDTQGKWKLVERTVDLEDRSVDLAGFTGDVKFQIEILNANSSKYLLVDDIRLLPIDAQMTTSTYDPVKGITSKSDLTGKVSRYEYDNFNRLKLIKDNDENILKRNTYHYKGEVEVVVEEPCPADIDLIPGQPVITDNTQGESIAFSFRIDNSGCKSKTGSINVEVQEKVGGTFGQNSTYTCDIPASVTVEDSNSVTVSGTMTTYSQQNGIFRLLYRFDDQETFTDEFVLGYVEGTIVWSAFPPCDDSPCGKEYVYKTASCVPEGAVCSTDPEPISKSCIDRYSGTGIDNCPDGNTTTIGPNIYCIIPDGFVGMTDHTDEWTNDKIFVERDDHSLKYKWEIKEGCFTYHWQTTAFTPACGRCDGITQEREVFCQDNYGNHYPDNYCSGTKPSSTHTCKVYEDDWDVGEWGECTNRGKQYRTVSCPSNCCPDPEPIAMRDCEGPPPPPPPTH